MARPKRNNAEYFTHDADMRNDVKIKALRRKFKHTGYAIWCFLLEVFTDSDFFEIEWNEINIELFSADFDISPEELSDIVDYCVKIELLTLSSEGKLYSKNQKRRFELLISKREKDRRIITEKKGKTEKKEKRENGVFGGENMAKTPENGVFGGENPHSKVKESKVKDINKTINISNLSYPPYQENKIVELWNSTCIDYAKVIKLTDARKNKIRVRMGEFASDPEQQIEVVKKIFEKMQDSKFLRGDNRNGWKASFDWIFENSKNWVKVLEGNYDNDKSPNGWFGNSINNQNTDGHETDSGSTGVDPLGQQRKAYIQRAAAEAVAECNSRSR